MKVKIPIGCICGEENVCYAIAGSAVPDVNCKCGRIIYGCGDVMVSEGVLSRSRDELLAGDSPLSIVLAAMATDCELAALFFKMEAN
jgi:hypothetical protein